MSKEIANNAAVTNAAVTNPSDTVSPSKGRRRPTQVRKHRKDTIYNQELVAYLDKLHAEGGEVLAILPASDVRGFDVVSFLEK